MTYSTQIIYIKQSVLLWLHSIRNQIFSPVRISTSHVPNWTAMPLIIVQYQGKKHCTYIPLSLLYSCVCSRMDSLRLHSLISRLSPNLWLHVCVVQRSYSIILIRYNTHEGEWLGTRLSTCIYYTSPTNSMYTLLYRPIPSTAMHFKIAMRRKAAMCLPLNTLFRKK